MAEQYGYEITLTAQLARRIDTEDQAREYEESTRCDNCDHLVAVVTDGPLSDMPPVCQNCMAEEMVTLTHTIKTLEEQRDLKHAIEKLRRTTRRTVMLGRCVMWAGGVAMAVMAVLNVQSGDYLVAAVDAGIVALYTWLFWRSFRRQEA